MKINCLSCGHNIDLDEAYADHYEGEVKCFGCDARLEIRTDQSAVRDVRLVGSPVDESARAESGRSQTTAGAGMKSGKTGSYRARSAAKQAATALNESDTQRAAPANNRAA
jgi:hypothetical protein